MKIKYDPEADALYISLIDKLYQVKTIHLSENIALDFAKGEKLVGIEILDVKKVLGRGNLPKIILDNIPKDSVRYINTI